MKTVNYSIRLDPDIKLKAEKTFSEFGLNLSEAINIFLHMSIKRRGFPFEIRDPEINAETLLAIQETEHILTEYKNGARAPRSFANAYEVFSAMDSEDEAEGENE